MSDLFHVTHGRGPTVLVMHGGLGLDHTYLRGALDPLGDELRLVYYDHRGNGRSPRVDDWSKITHATLVDDADALRASLGEERVIVLGHSYGAFLALEYALRHPTRVSALILVGGSARLKHMEHSMALAKARLSEEDFARVLRDFTTVPDDAEYAREWPWLQRLYMHRYDEATVADMLKDVIYRADAMAHALGQMAATYDVTDRLGEIACPTLIVAGRHDWIEPPDVAATPLHEGIPNSELAVFEQSGHYPFVEEPGAFRAIVAHFVKRATT